MSNLIITGSIKYSELNINDLYNVLESIATGGIDPASSIRGSTFDPTPGLIGGLHYWDHYFPDANGYRSWILDEGQYFQAFAKYSSMYRINQEVFIVAGQPSNEDNQVSQLDWQLEVYGPTANFYNSVQNLAKLLLIPPFKYNHEQHSGKIQRVVHDWIINNQINGKFETTIPNLSIMSRYQPNLYLDELSILVRKLGQIKSRSDP